MGAGRILRPQPSPPSRYARRGLVTNLGFRSGTSGVKIPD
jgi:hypothetical protein